MTRSAIAWVVENGDWRRVYPGVFLVNQARLTWKARLMAAILWAGPGAVASHRSAAALLGLQHGDKSIVEITSPRRLNPPAGIKAHHDPSLASRPSAIADNIPVTRLSWTLLDLCSVLSFSAAMSAVTHAVRNTPVGVLDLSRLLDQAGARRGGRATLRKILVSRFALGVTDSDAEDLFIGMAKRRGLEFVHHFVVRDARLTAELDFADPTILLDIEVDGGKDHDDPVAVQRDKNRDAELMSRGWAVLRFTYWDLIKKPDWVFEMVLTSMRNRQATMASEG